MRASRPCDAIGLLQPAMLLVSCNVQQRGHEHVGCYGAVKDRPLVQLTDVHSSGETVQL
jgi:hypothetical protein